jgi:hypothetical protein
MAPKRRLVNAKVIPVSTKENFRRPVPKTYSYRYEVAADAGPAGEPLVRKGAAIIEGRYRGRAATWNVGRSMVDPVTYLAKGSYVHPLEDNPMAYPPRHAPAEVKHVRTPGFAATAAQKVVRPATRFDTNVPPATAPQPGSVGTPPAAAPPGRRGPTPANEPAAYRKTG